MVTYSKAVQDSILANSKDVAFGHEPVFTEGRHFKTAAAKKHTLADMIDRDLSSNTFTKKQTEHQVLHLERRKTELGSYTLADVTPDLITDIKDKLLSEITPKGTPRSHRYLHKFKRVVKAQWERL